MQSKNAITIVHVMAGMRSMHKLYVQICICYMCIVINYMCVIWNTDIGRVLKYSKCIVANFLEVKTGTYHCVRKFLMTTPPFDTVPLID